MNPPDDRIIEAIKSAHAITWDECHKIYITADTGMTAELKSNGYPMTLIKPDVDTAEILQAWYDQSCSLRFISKIHSPGKNEDYENVIPQFDGEQTLTLVPTEYGYSVHCYGSCTKTANIFMCFDDEMYDGHSESSFTSWEGAVAEISDYAHRNNTTLEQLESDMS